MKKGLLYHEVVKKKTTVGSSYLSKRRHGIKNRQKKFSADYRGQGR